MRKYNDPQIDIEMFCTENIITSSVDAASFIEQDSFSNVTSGDSESNWAKMDS